MIKLVLYDADGVLIHSELATVELERQYGIPHAVSKEFFAREWDDLLAGKADTREKLAPYLQKWSWKGSVEDYQKFWFEFEHKLDEGLISHIQELRKQGIICAVATNQDTYRAAYMLEKMGFDHSFDAMYASAHLGTAKPDKEFFELILQKYEIPPEEIIFWDDKVENIEPARQLGMLAEVYTNFENYKAKMKEFVS